MNEYLSADPNTEYFIGYTDYNAGMGEPILGTAGGPNPIPVFGSPTEGSKQLLVFRFYSHFKEFMHINLVFYIIHVFVLL